MTIQIQPSTLEEEIARVKHFVKNYTSITNLTSDIIFPSNFVIGKHNVTQLVADEYSISFYKSGVDKVLENKSIIEKASETLLTYQKTWGFYLTDPLIIRLTRYGTGGSYDVVTKRIIMRTSQNGTFARSNPAATPIHELTHICVEHLVEKYNLTYLEKERLVNGICGALFPSIFDPNDKLTEETKTFRLIVMQDLPEYIKNNIGLLRATTM